MRFPDDGPLAAFIQRLPKTETHLHLEGATPLAHLREAGLYREPHDPPFWREDFRFRDFGEFQDLFGLYLLPYYNSPERYHRTATAVFRDLAAQGVRYVETSFHAGLALTFASGGPEDVIAAIRAAAPPGLQVEVFAGFLHNDYAGPMIPLMDSAPDWEGLTGVDLHGPEDWPLEPWSAAFWRRMSEAGKSNKAHAGEFLGADFIERVVDELGVSRIEHGIRAAESPSTLRRLAEQGVALDVCPISNLKLRAGGISSLEEHPIRHLVDAGLTVTISSDDPFLFGNRLVDEYAALHRHLGFSASELAELAKNGFRVARMDPAGREAILAEIDALLASLPAGA